MNPRDVQPERPDRRHARRHRRARLVRDRDGRRAGSAPPQRDHVSVLLRQRCSSSASRSHLQFSCRSSPQSQPPWLRQAPASATSASTLKWRLLDDAPILGDFAVLPALKFPTGSQPRGTGTGTHRRIAAPQLRAMTLVRSRWSTSTPATRAAAATVRTAPRNATLWTASFGGPAVGRTSAGSAELYTGYPGDVRRSRGAVADRRAARRSDLPAAKNWLAFDAGFIADRIPGELLAHSRTRFTLAPSSTSDGCGSARERETCHEPSRV